MKNHLMKVREVFIKNFKIVVLLSLQKKQAENLQTTILFKLKVVVNQ